MANNLRKYSKGLGNAVKFHPLALGYPATAPCFHLSIPFFLPLVQNVSVQLQRSKVRP